MRNVEKSIAEYDRLFVTGKNKSGCGAFYTQEYKQLYDMGRGDPWIIIDNSIRFGFMVGMRYGMKKAKQKAAAGTLAQSGTA